jgi:hypothetical protein
MPARRFVSFEGLEEVVFFASRGEREGEFSGPPPKGIEMENGDSQSSDFECSPDRNVPKRMPSKGLLQRQDEVAFDASRGESLFTASDLPVFDDPPVLCISTASSEFDERAKKKVVVFDPKVIQSQKRAPDVRTRNTCSVPLTFASTVARAFSLWKGRFREKVGRPPSVHVPVPVRAPLRQPLSRLNAAPGEEDTLNRSRVAERRLKVLAEKHALISQIERQRDINGRLEARMEQIRKETAVIRSRQGSPPVESNRFHSRSGA